MEEAEGWWENQRTQVRVKKTCKAVTWTWNKMMKYQHKTESSPFFSPKNLKEASAQSRVQTSNQNSFLTQTWEGNIQQDIPRPCLLREYFALDTTFKTQKKLNWRKLKFYCFLSHLTSHYPETETKVTTAQSKTPSHLNLFFPPTIYNKFNKHAQL